jgi:hypothetical protein
MGMLGDQIPAYAAINFGGRFGARELERHYGGI